MVSTQPDYTSHHPLQLHRLTELKALDAYEVRRIKQLVVSDASGLGGGGRHRTRGGRLEGRRTLRGETLDQLWS